MKMNYITRVQLISFLVVGSIVAAIGYGAFVSIRSRSLKRGTVIEKYHADAWVQTSFIYINNGSSTMMIPQITEWPERWEVTIEGKNPKGQHLTRNLELEEPDYNRIEVGQQIEVP